jgi:hypothetical protein
MPASTVAKDNPSKQIEYTANSISPVFFFSVANGEPSIVRFMGFAPVIMVNR